MLICVTAAEKLNPLETEPNFDNFHTMNCFYFTDYYGQRGNMSSRFSSNSEAKENIGELFSQYYIQSDI